MNYESIYGAMAVEHPNWGIGHYNADLLWRRNFAGGVENPVLAATQAAYFGATSIDEQMKAAREFGMEVIRQHYLIWGPMAPRYQASQPWVKGFNGETCMWWCRPSDLARLWIDQDLKREMGF